MQKMGFQGRILMIKSTGSIQGVSKPLRRRGEAINSRRSFGWKLILSHTGPELFFRARESELKNFGGYATALGSGAAAGEPTAAALQVAIQRRQATPSHWSRTNTGLRSH